MRIIILLIGFCSYTLMQGQTIGLTEYQQDNTDGYVLFTGIASKQTYLIDKCGQKIKEWNSSYKPGLSVELLPTGDLFRTGLSASSSFGSGGGKGGILEKYDWDGNLLWSYQISDTNQCQHHDAIVLANGNVLAIVWDRITFSNATASGKNPAVTSVLSNQEVWSEKIIELQPIGTDSAKIVWEWRAWDHLVQDFDNSKNNYGTVSAHPELINVNYVLQGPPTNPDWLHINSIDLNPITDEIILSNHNFGEFWIIDHSTTTAEAGSHSGGNSGKGGDLLYRWGNPMTYDRGTVADQKLFKQHHATFIKAGYPNAGKVLVFNNGVNRPDGNYSSIDMIDIREAGYPYNTGATSPFLPNSTFWSYTAATRSSFYAANISGVFPLMNGSFLITDGPKGKIFEIDSTSKIKWQYINPTNNVGPMSQGSIPSSNTVFRGNFYLPNYTAFTNKVLSPISEIELNPTSPSLCSVLSLMETDADQNQFKIFPNPLHSLDQLTIESKIQGEFQITVIDLNGKNVYYQTILNAGKKTIQLPSLKKGLYFIHFTGEKEVLQTNKIMVL